MEQREIKQLRQSHGIRTQIMIELQFKRLLRRFPNPAACPIAKNVH